MQKKTQKVGLITATSLVVGNMIGAGIYVLPSALAGYGSVSIVGWVLTALGALVLAKIFGISARSSSIKVVDPIPIQEKGLVIL